MSSPELHLEFLRSLAQTSDSPMGLVVSSARGATISTAERDYIDLLAGMGVAALGHGNELVKQAIHKQIEDYLHVMVYGEFVIEPQVALAKRLVELLPQNLESVYFTNSGAEAVEGALKLARKATGRSKLVSFHGSFHGDTLGALSVGGNPIYREPFAPLLPQVEFIAFNDPAGLDSITQETAAVIVEPVQAEAGVIAAEDGFLTSLRRRCDRSKALLIYDEVVTGLGRTGKLFAFEHENAVPDILVLAKALGGGTPLGAFISSRKIMSALSHDPALGHVTTFGGHPLCCAAGLACLNQIIDDNLPAQAQAKGIAFATKLRERLDADAVRQVRQVGLLIGIEFHDAQIAQSFTKAGRREGLIIGWTLHNDAVVRLAPPLIISEAELDEASLRMQRALARVLGQGM